MLLRRSIVNYRTKKLYNLRYHKKHLFNTKKHCYYSILLKKIYNHNNANSTAIIENFQNNNNNNINYKDLAKQIDNFSINLSASINNAKNITNNDGSTIKKTIAFLCKPSINYVITLLAIWRLGHVAVPLSPLHPANEILHVINDSKSDVIISEESLNKLIIIDDDEDVNIHNVDFETIAKNNVINENDFKKLSQLIIKKDHHDNVDDDAYIVYTSGTTGKPKGVVHSHKAIQTQIEDMIEEWKWSSSDHILHFLPLHHLHGIVNKLFCCLYVGGIVEFIESHPDILWDRIIENGNNNNTINNYNNKNQSGATLFMAVPTIYQKLIEQYHTLPKEKQVEVQEACKSFRLMISGSAALPINVLNEWENITGHFLLERYGMSEFCMGLTNPYEPIENRIPGYVGMNFPSVDIRLCNYEEEDENDSNFSGQESKNAVITDDPISLPSLKNGQSSPGEIRIKGNGMFSRYLNLDDITKKSFDSNGYFKTGDIAIYDSDVNSFKILGRKSTDIIKHKGYKISALEIERYLLEHPNILEACVFGIPDERYGESIYCLLRCVEESLNNIDDDDCGDENTTKKPVVFEDELNTFLLKRLAKYKLPSQYIMVDNIPKNAMGKVNKKDVKKKYYGPAVVDLYKKVGV